jgi:hypothetical protein
MLEDRMAEDRITVGRMEGIKGIVGNMMACYRVADDRISGNRMAEMRFQGVGWKGAGDGRMIVSGAEGHMIGSRTTGTVSPRQGSRK